jgi:hypothetical protein
MTKILYSEERSFTIQLTRRRIHSASNNEGWVVKNCISASCPGAKNRFDRVICR